MKVVKSPGERIVDVLILLFMWFVIVITLYPFIYVISMSISDPIYAIKQEVWLLPKGFSLGAYEMCFKNPDIWRSYYNTIIYTVFGTMINIFMTTIAAYPLSRKKFVFKNVFMLGIAFTMFFGGGLIPSFLLIQKLGIYNTRWAMLIPGAVGAYYIIIARTYFETIPDSLQESAKLDGANDIMILFRIFLPLSKPIIAVLTLFYAVGHWNSYFSALLYLPNAELQPLQLYLVKILIQNQQSMLEGMTDQFERTLYAVQLKYAAIIVSILPIICVYPFLQKYFVKGVMIGAIKQ
jgi:putative aldouronate transport system permease protein